MPTITPNSATATPTIAASEVNDSPTDNLPGKKLALGSRVTSELDVETWPREVYSVDLEEGQTLRVTVRSNTSVNAFIFKPGAEDIDSPDETVCDSDTSCTRTLLAVVSGTYYVSVHALETGTEYTLSIDVE